MGKMHQKGFSLVELMIVVAIVGIIASFAYPSYEEYVTRSKRSDAMAALVQASQAMERYRSQAPYDYDVAALSDVFATQVPVEGGTAYYQLTIANDATSYTITATPVGSMAGKDPLTLSNTGARTWGAKNCWPEGGSSC